MVDTKYLQKNILEHRDEDGDYVPPFDQTGADEFDISEYLEGEDGFGPLLPDALEKAGYKGNVEQFYGNVLGVMTNYVEEHNTELNDDGEIVINIPLALPNTTLYAAAICDMDGAELFRFDAIPECVVTIDGEEFDIQEWVERTYVDNFIQHPDARRFRSDEEASLMEIAKKRK